MHQAGPAGRIHFRECIPPEQVQPLLQRSQAILLMSDFEVLPVGLLEAMAAGVVPVVWAIESGIPELVHHERTGWLVGNDPTEAAAALVRMRREPELWQRCSTQARALVEAGYGADQCFESWLGLMEQQRRPTRPPFPIRTAGLHCLLPLADARFQSQVPSPPPRWSWLQPRGMLGRLKRMAGQLA